MENIFNNEIINIIIIGISINLALFLLDMFISILITIKGIKDIKNNIQLILEIKKLSEKFSFWEKHELKLIILMPFAYIPNFIKNILTYNQAKYYWKYVLLLSVLPKLRKHYNSKEIKNLEKILLENKI